MKRVVLLAFLVLVFMLPLFAQSVVEKSETEKVHLTFVEAMANEGRTLILQQAIENFEKEHPNIDIDLISPAENEAEETIRKMLENGEKIDICEIRDQSVAKLLDENLLAPLDEYIFGSDLADRLLDATFTATKAFNSSGSYFFIMQYMYVKALIVRTDILEEYGLEIPTTMQEFYETCVKITQSGDGPCGYGLKGTNPLRILDPLLLGEIENIDPENVYTTTDGSFYLDTEDGRAALNSYLDLYKYGSAEETVNWSFYDQIEKFISGECTFIVQDPDALSMIFEVLDEDQFAVAYIPVGSSGKRYLDYGFAGLAIAANSEHKDEAYEFISFMLSTNVNAQICEFYGALPVVKEVYEVSSMYGDEHYQVGLASLKDEDTVLFSFPLDDPKFRDYMKLYTTAISDMLLENKTVDETIQILKDFWTN